MHDFYEDVYPQFMNKLKTLDTIKKKRMVKTFPNENQLKIIKIQKTNVMLKKNAMLSTLPRSNPKKWLTKRMLTKKRKVSHHKSLPTKLKSRRVSTMKRNSW